MIGLAELATFCTDRSAIGTPLTHIRPHLEYFLSETESIFTKKRTENISTIAQLLGRSMLEGILTCILFRSDEFRAVTLLNFQSHKDFEHNRPNTVSINWREDLVPGQSDEPKDMWKPNISPSHLSRALLSKYNDFVSWHPAFLRTVDYLSNQPSSSGAPSIFTLDPDAALNRVRGEARQLYSFWSKGLHCEFFCMAPHILDDVTCIEKLKRTVDILTDLVFMSHFLNHSTHTLTPDAAFVLYDKTKASVYA